MEESTISALLPAIQDRTWLTRFTKREYADAFEEYLHVYSHYYRRAVMDAAAVSVLADALLDALSAGWKSERFWNRSVRRFEEKRMLICYLAPMLLEIGEEPFAQALRDAWSARWPKDAWQYAPWQVLRRSFSNTILGFPVHAGNNTEEGDA